MTKSKKPSRKNSVKVPDLAAKKDPKGGDINITKSTDTSSSTLFNATGTTTSK